MSSEYSSGGKHGEVVGKKLPGSDGNYRRIPIPDLEIGKDGRPTEGSWNKLLDALQKRAGKNTRPDLKCDSEADEEKVYDKILQDAVNKNREKYSWNPFRPKHCRTVADDAFDAGRKDSGWW